MKKYLRIFLTILPLYSVPFGLFAAPQARLQVSQISGVAPMAVHFDAIGTTDSSVVDPFRELRYDFNFGDPSSGTWQYSGKSKNSQSGAPLAAHVYDNPGTYTATLRVGSDTERVTITVQDPNSVFSGAKTVCLSRNTDMAGCPSGATRLSNVNTWPAIADGRRYMLRAGQNFSTLGNLNTRQIHNVRFTSFGAGAKPALANIFLQEVRTNYTGAWVSNVDIIGLSPTEIAHGITGNNILVYQNTMSGEGSIYFSHGHDNQRRNGRYNNTLVMARNIFVVGNESTSRGGRHTGEGQTVWMDNLFDNTSEHNLRLWQSYKSIIAHNKFPGHATKSGKENIKTHAKGLNIVVPGGIISPTTELRTSYVVVADNILNSSNSQNIWNTIGAKPQDRYALEGIENYIMERNTHIKGSQDLTPGGFAGRNIITRDEIFIGNTRQPSVGHLQQSLPQSWQGPYFIGVPLPPPPQAGIGYLAAIFSILLH